MRGLGVTVARRCRCLVHPSACLAVGVLARLAVALARLSALDRLPHIARLAAELDRLARLSALERLARLTIELASDTARRPRSEQHSIGSI